MGGLTAGSLLAQLAGARVLVLERHHRLGGLLHEFSRPDGGRWSVGLHYVGQMHAHGRLRRLMDFVTGGTEWAPFPDPVERYVYPGLSIPQPAGRDAFVEELCHRWPRERSGILRYFASVRGATRWLRSDATPGPRFSDGAPGSFTERTTGEVLDSCVRNSRLKAVLVSQWGNYGLPPSRSSFLAHAITVDHYLEGGWVPVGGTGPMIRGARAAIELAGGECRTSSDVSEIMIEDDRAVGVRLRAGAGTPASIARAPLVISDAGARTTYRRLLHRYTSLELERIRSWLDGLGPSYTVVQLFLGLSKPAAELGVRGENYWIFHSFDHDETFRSRDLLLDGRAGGAFVSFPTAKDPAANYHTAEVIAPVSKEAFNRWSDLPWRRRGGEYEALKARVIDALLGLVEQHIPGIKAAATYRELATPLSIEHFTGHDGGAAYGLPATPERFDGLGASSDTPVQGLLLAGSDAAIHGVVGAMIGGVAAVSRAPGEYGFQRILSAARATRKDARS